MSLFLAILMGGATPAGAPEPDPKIMTQKEIRAFNASLDRHDPNYIRCVKSPEIGSLVKFTYSCRTNRQWANADQTGNDNARETYGAMTSKAWDTSN